MSQCICKCCGEPMAEKSALGGNPNVCGSCSALADAMSEVSAAERSDFAEAQMTLANVGNGGLMEISWESAIHAIVARRGA